MDQRGSYQFAEPWWQMHSIHDRREEGTRHLMLFQARGLDCNFPRLDDPFDTKT